jgi:anti-sigma B factor antagonist
MRSAPGKRPILKKLVITEGILFAAGTAKRLDFYRKMCDNKCRKVAEAYSFSRKSDGKSNKMDETVDVEITGTDSLAVVAFKGTSISDSEKIAVVFKRINEFIDKSHPKKIVMDFQQVKFFSSQVLGVLLNTRAKLKAYGGEVVISAINPQMYRVFKITNLDKIFKFFPDRDSAVKTVNIN